MKILELLSKIWRKLILKKYKNLILPQIWIQDKKSNTNIGGVFFNV